MPELPEVECVKLGLLPLQGLILHQIKVLDSHLRQAIPTNLNLLIGKKLLKIERRAKYLIFQFEGAKSEEFLVIHLGMTGRLEFREFPTKHDKLLFQFEENGQFKTLFFSDVRRFGVATWSYNIDWDKVGIEPLSPSFTPQCLTKLAHLCHSPMKNFLLNQHYIAGLGNIYVCEALFMAGLSPFKIANTLTTKQVTALHGAIVKVLRAAIEKGGSTLRDYRGVDGKTGDFQKEFKVYDHENESCPICGTPITRDKQQGRSTYWCKVCQV